MCGCSARWQMAGFARAQLRPRAGEALTFAARIIECNNVAVPRFHGARETNDGGATWTKCCWSRRWASPLLLSRPGGGGIGHGFAGSGVRSATGSPMLQGCPGRRHHGRGGGCNGAAVLTSMRAIGPAITPQLRADSTTTVATIGPTRLPALGPEQPELRSGVVVGGGCAADELRLRALGLGRRQPALGPRRLWPSPSPRFGFLRLAAALGSTRADIRSVRIRLEHAADFFALGQPLGHFGGGQCGADKV